MASSRDAISRLNKVFDESDRISNYHQIVEFWVDTPIKNKINIRVYYFPDRCSAESYCSFLYSERNKFVDMPFVIYLNQEIFNMSETRFTFDR